jgi:tRNA nucleotidyltransferase/poly(A) polymerase
MASPSSFAEDPVRTLRAVRMQAQFACIIEPQTRSRLQAAAPLLGRTSAERVRDEWFKILQAPGAANALRELHQLGLLRIVAPPLANLEHASPPAPGGQDALHHAFETVHAIERLWALFGQYPSDLPSFLPATLFALAPQIRQRYEAPICDERSHLALLKCAALLHTTSVTRSQDTAAEAAAELGSQWRCSKREIECLRTAVGYHADVRQLTGEPNLSRRAIYRYYLETGEYGIDAALLSLADTLAAWEGEALPEAWPHQAEMVAQLLTAWFEHGDTMISPQLYLSGNDLIRLLGLSPGPQIGDLLHRLREEQAAGEIRTRQEAIIRVRQWASRARGMRGKPPK